MKLVKRVITSICLFASFVALLAMGDLYFWTFILLISLMIGKETLKMQQKNVFSLWGLCSFLLIIFVFFIILIPFTNPIWDSIVFQLCYLLFFLVACVEIMKKKIFYGSNSLILFFRLLVLIAVSLPYVVLMRDHILGFQYCLFVCLMINGTDIAAYFIGKYYGQKKVTDISPKKTRIGYIGGITFGIFVGIVSIQLMSFPASFYIFCVLVPFLSQFGDLYESLIKRSLNVKDSSQALPGHGGFFDRADSSLFVLPIFYYIEKLL